MTIEHICRTAGCFAGWRAFRDGYTYQGDRNIYSGLPLLVDAAGRRLAKSVPAYAQDRLELSDDEARELFHGCNTMADLKHIVDELCAQEGRSDESKRLLRETIDDVLAADAEDLWDQENWVHPADGVFKNPGDDDDD